jgi:hypothetical protein
VSSVDGPIIEVATEVQAKLDVLYAQPGVPAPGSPLDQAGLREGLEIVDDYLRHGEVGLAFHHLLYMIREPDIALSRDAMARLQSVATAMGMPDATLGVRREG